ncbi:cation:proton antiporter [Streptomyces sp. ME19-01-6]|uniref:cation:proton antiporter domain-containing protein n=1 Tax=Streptomyces sp. ME19-01-6 TaxID=3028686 RepID=UPI0029BD6926|nr:cation:proton antiporter [Streptomyces sp. ME19-01-6]MDX3227791.1 cation:proton antiporter [Streptomyces sp. ME19-01-6]
MKTAMPVEELLPALAAIVLLVRGVHALARRCRQPAVVAELAAGILLGLALRLVLTDEAEAAILTRPVREGLTALGGLGLLLFLFETGCGAGGGPAPRHGRRALWIGGTAFLVPFAAGLGAAYAIVGEHGPGASRTTAFVLFLATALAVTALPVLARIVDDLGLADTRLGTLAVGGAAVCDALAWTVLAVALAVDGEREPGRAAAGLAGCAVYTLALLTVVRPVVRRLTARGPAAPYGTAALLCAGVLLSSYVTALLGVHAIFGAFLFGFAVRPAGPPRGQGPAAPAPNPLGPARAVLRPVAGLLAPVYFVVSGMAVNVSAVAAQLWLLGFLGGVALVAKVTAAAGAGALCGLGRRESVLLAVLLNTRGVTELVILSIGWSSGLLDQQIYGAMTVFALFATALTGPVLLRWGSARPADPATAPPHPSSKPSPEPQRKAETL